MPNATKTVVILSQRPSWETLESLCYREGMSLARVASDLGLSDPSPPLWCNTRSIWGVLEGHLVPSPFHVALNQRSST